MMELLVLLGLFIATMLVSVFVVLRFNKRRVKDIAINENELINFETMLVPLEFSSSSHEQLEEACAKFFQHYDELDMTTVQKRFLLYTLAKHPNVRSELVLHTLNTMSERNPSIAKELEASVKKGLDRRDLLSKMT